MADVTDKDRLAAYTLDALIGTRFNTQSDPQIVAWCEQYVAQARAEGRAEEREACASACVAKHITRAEWTGDRWDEGYTSGVKACEAAIRARGEKGED